MDLDLTSKFLAFTLLGAQWVLWLLIGLSVISVAPSILKVPLEYLLTLALLAAASAGQAAAQEKRVKQPAKTVFTDTDAFPAALGASLIASEPDLTFQAGASNGANIVSWAVNAAALNGAEHRRGHLAVSS